MNKMSSGREPVRRAGTDWAGTDWAGGQDRASLKDGIGTSRSHQSWTACCAGLAGFSGAGRGVRAACAAAGQVNYYVQMNVYRNR